jgi:hypothetical protein
MNADTAPGDTPSDVAIDLTSTTNAAAPLGTSSELPGGEIAASSMPMQLA